jgi:DUF971 family protein
MTQKTTLRQENEPQGMVVWDQRGLVVVWPDQHCSRFSWEALRHICLCAECQGQRPAPETVPQYSV